MTVWNRGLVVAGVTLALTLARASEAVTTYTPPVRSSSGDNLGCFLQNLTAQPVEVDSEINNGLGTIIDPRTSTVMPGNVLQLSRTTDQVFGAHCVFDFAGDPSQVRGFISLQDAGGGNTRLLFPATVIDDLPPQLEARTFTPPVRSDEGDNLGCFLQNLSSAPVQVASEIQNGLGTVVDPRTSTVEAGQTLQLSRTSDQVFGAYCTFVFEGSPSQVRGFISLQDAGGSNTRLLYPASPFASVGPPLTATPTATAPGVTPTPTQTGGPPAACCGDCNGNTQVTIDELISAVNRALLGCEEP